MLLGIYADADHSQEIYGKCLEQRCKAVGVSCPLTEFCSLQNSLYVEVLHSIILAALLHGTPAAGVSQTLQRGTRNGITELS